MRCVCVGLFLLIKAATAAAMQNYSPTQSHLHDVKQCLWLSRVFLSIQHAVLFVAVAPVLHQDLNAPLATLWCTLSWSWPQGSPQITALSRSSPSLSWLTLPCPVTAEAFCTRYKPGTHLYRTLWEKDIVCIKLKTVIHKLFCQSWISISLFPKWECFRINLHRWADPTVSVHFKTS